MNMKNTSELSQAVAKLGITSKAIHLKYVMSSKADDKWAHDLWEVTLSYQGRELTTSYRTGLGHRVKHHHITQRGDVYNGPQGNARGIERATSVGYTKPVEPSVGDVVHSLIVDSSCIDKTFEDWCGEFGYDTDSRKALDTYLQCQESLTKSRKLLTYATLDSLIGLEH
jgi:hypothetical protein